MPVLTFGQERRGDTPSASLNGPQAEKVGAVPLRLGLAVMMVVGGIARLAVGSETLGSTIYNILAILGVASLIAPVPIAPEIARIEMWVMPAFALALVPALIRGRIARALGALLVAAYAAYVACLVLLQV